MSCYTRFTVRSRFAIIVCFCLFLVANNTFCQEVDSEHEGHRKHQLGLVVGYAWVPKALETVTGNKTVAIPAIGLDYSYWLKHRFALRLVNDVELSRYVIEEENGTYLEREYKYIGAITAVWEASELLAFYGGPGMELEANENFFVVKLGAEVVKEFEEGWSAGLNISVDINELYQTYSAGLFLARQF